MKHVQMYLGVERDTAGQYISPSTRSNAIAQIRRQAADQFGGYTLSNAEGGWVDDKGMLVIEGAVKLDIYVHDRTPPRALRRLAQNFGRLLQQSSVLLDIAGQAEVLRVNANDTSVTKRKVLLRTTRKARRENHKADDFQLNA